MEKEIRECVAGSSPSLRREGPLGGGKGKTGFGGHPRVRRPPWLNLVSGFPSSLRRPSASRASFWIDGQAHGWRSLACPFELSGRWRMHDASGATMGNRVPIRAVKHAKSVNNIDQTPLVSSPR